MVKRNNYLAKVRSFIGLDVVKVLTGMRRSGKSVLMEQIRDVIRREIDPAAQFISINLELDENKHFLSKGVLHDYVLSRVNTGRGKKTYVFLDEISDVEEWEKCVNSLRAHKDITRIMNYVMSETGHTFSAASIQRYLKHENRPVSFETVMNYLSFGEEAFLFNAVKREDLIGKRILDVDAKYYAMDHGMRRAVVGGNAKRDIDRTLEAIVYRELVRRDYAVTIGRVKEKEVDFVCQRANERLYVQVAYVMATEETQEREFSALRAVPDQYSKLVLSMDRFDLSEGGIVHRYLPDFLLEESEVRN